MIDGPSYLSFLKLHSVLDNIVTISCYITTSHKSWPCLKNPFTWETCVSTPIEMREIAI